jgi:hypothetical protein
MTTTEQMRASVQVRLQTHSVFVHAEDFAKSLNVHQQKTSWAEPKENCSSDDERRCEFLYLGELSVLNALLGCGACLHLKLGLHFVASVKRTRRLRFAAYARMKRDHGSTFAKSLIDQCSEKRWASMTRVEFEQPNALMKQC